MYNHCALSTSQFNRTLYKRAASNIQVPGAGITMSGAQKHACYDELDANLLAAEPNLIKWRRQIHQNPELGYYEVETSKLVADALKSMGYEVHAGWAKTGVVGILRGQSERPLIGLRADIDALPIKEETGLPFASTKIFTPPNGDAVPVSHACGHDCHTAIVLAAAEALSKTKDSLKGSVMIIFQPCEESSADAKGWGMQSSGAMQMVFREKLFEKLPKPDAFFGLHVTGLMHGGLIAIRPGPAMAAADMFSATITGKQTHGSQPWTGKDAVLCAAQAVCNLQSIVSREANIQEHGAAVVTVGTINGGVRCNVVGGSCTMTGTLRAITDENRRLVRQRTEEIIKATAAMAGCVAEVSFDDGIPPVINDPDASARALEVVRDVAQIPVSPPLPGVMGADDMSAFHTLAPSLYMFLLCAPEPGKLLMNHMSNFDVDESQLINGCRALAHLAANLMEFPLKSNTFKPTYDEWMANEEAAMKALKL